MINEQVKVMTKLEELKAADDAAWKAVAALDAAADDARDDYVTELKKIHEENCNG